MGLVQRAKTAANVFAGSCRGHCKRLFRASIFLYYPQMFCFFHFINILALNWDNVQKCVVFRNFLLTVILFIIKSKYFKAYLEHGYKDATEV